MIRCDALIRILTAEFSANNPDGPRLKLINSKSGEEGFSLAYAGGTFTLTSGHPHSMVYGISSLRTACASGHIGEFTGQYKPLFALRPLWIKGLELNAFDADHKVELFCKRMLLLGYNAVIVELDFDKIGSVDVFFQTLHNYGIQTIFKPLIDKSKIPSFTDPEFANTIHRLLEPSLNLKALNFILWTSSIYNAPSHSSLHSRDLLHRDLAAGEIQTLEDVLKNACGLIYYLPSVNPQIAEKQGKWIADFSKSALGKTLIAFSANTGDPLDDYLPRHPLWNSLRSSKRPSKCNLLPLINVGLANQGEGFWPTIALDQIEGYIVRCKPTVFSGAVVITAHLPKENAWLACGLWTASQILWGQHNAHLIVESWIKAHRPELLEHSDPLKVFEECRKVEIQLGKLSSLVKANHALASKEEFRLLTECLLATLRQLQSTINEKKVHASNLPTIVDRFSIFSRDARKLIMRFLQHYNMPLVNVMNGDDMQESFWTEVANSGSLGMSASVKIIQRDKPNKGKPDSAMAKIYDEIVAM